MIITIPPPSLPAGCLVHLFFFPSHAPSIQTSWPFLALCDTTSAPLAMIQLRFPLAALPRHTQIKVINHVCLIAGLISFFPVSFLLFFLFVPTLGRLLLSPSQAFVPPRQALVLSCLVSAILTSPLLPSLEPSPLPLSELLPRPSL